MRRAVLWLGVCAMQAQTAAPPRADNRIPQALPQIVAAAERFAQAAPHLIADEQLSQRAVQREKHPKKKQEQPGELNFKTRRIVSCYGFSTFDHSPALHEVRQLVSVDGQAVASAQEARRALRDALVSHDDALKRKMMEQFVKEGLADAATDFGQLILLFGRDTIKDFSFEYQGEETIGAVATEIFSFAQQTGKEAMRINTAGKQRKEPLRGKVWVRLPDHLPVRMTVTSIGADHGIKIRDEAEVDYTEQSGTLLPALISHRRFANDDIVVQDVYQYSGWQPLERR